MFCARFPLLSSLQSKAAKPSEEGLGVVCARPKDACYQRDARTRECLALLQTTPPIRAPLLTGCAVDIRVAGIEQALRYAVILMDYADETKQDYDELFIEKNRYGAIWLHFAVRPSDNRRKVRLIQTT